MTSPLFNAATETLLDGFIKSSSHALLIEAPFGAGKQTALNYLAVKIGGQVVYRSADGETITIESIRSLRRDLQLKSQQNEQRLVIINQAERLTPEAQNALLKYLEEPVDGVRYLMSTPDRQRLLPTIVSRCSVLTIARPTSSQLHSYFAEQGYSAAKITAAIALSDGWPGLMSTILQNDEGLAQIIKQAKELVAAPSLAKVMTVDELASRKDLDQLLYVLERIYSSGLRAANAQQKPLTAWLKKLHLVNSAQNDLAHKVSSKLVLTKLLINL